MNLKFILIIVTISILLLFSFNKYRVAKHDREHQHIILTSYNFKDQPQQLKTNTEPFPFKGFNITPMATFVIRARVLSRQNYSNDFEAKLSPIDLALGWKRMADPGVYEKLNISQSGRWYRYSWAAQPPIPPKEIIESSGNMHMIPENQSVEDILRLVKKGDFVKIKGLLVKIAHNSGWRWESSLSREDSGAGSCEVVFVTEAEIE
jgi:hypothetical protein